MQQAALLLDGCHYLSEKGSQDYRGEMAQAWTADLKSNHHPNKTTLAHLLSWFKCNLSAYSLCILSMNFYTTFTSFGLFKLNHSKLFHLLCLCTKRFFHPTQTLCNKKLPLQPDTTERKAAHTTSRWDHSWEWSHYQCLLEMYTSKKNKILSSA